MVNYTGLSSCLMLASSQLKLESMLELLWLRLDDISNYVRLQYQMIDLYAIVNDDHIMEKYLRVARTRRQMEALIRYIVKLIKQGQSKVVKSMKIGNYVVYYFQQASFIFLLATKIETRVQRMQNYLRVIAEIFYQNYDEKKFHYVLDRIIEQINKTEFGAKKQSTLGEDEESVLMSSSMLQQKIKLSSIIDKKQKSSSRAYAIMTVLFLAIVILAGLYLARKWN